MERCSCKLIVNKKNVSFCLKDPIWLLPEHRLVHAHPRHGHVQRDPYLRHDKWHLLQVRHQLSLRQSSSTPPEHTAMLWWKLQLGPVTVLNPDCPTAFLMTQSGFNGWFFVFVSLKSVLSSLYYDYTQQTAPLLSFFLCTDLCSSL